MVLATLLAAANRGISQEKLPLYLGFFEFVQTPGAEAKLSLAPSSRLWSCDVPLPPRNPIRATAEMLRALATTLEAPTR